ncbi:type I restriction-modification system subunit M N-terminal domain-containing protein, partial [Staphylococcus aureus]
MSITEKQRQQQAELQKNLWSIADDLRGNMDANEFKNYILGMIFYRFLSEKIEEQAQILLAEDNIDYETAMADEDYRPVLEQEFISRIGYVIEPQYLFGHLVKKIEKQAFEMEDLSNAIKNIENSTRGHDSEDDFIHLFDDLDLNSSRLGNSNAARTKLISKVMMKISTLPFVHSDM